MLTVESVAKAIDVPVEDWVGDCYGVACACVEEGLVDGVVVHGHFAGEIRPDSSWRALRKTSSITRHGWVILNDGRIFDPTRWCFEGSPYLYFGVDFDDYDEGGNRFRQQCTPHRPVPEFDESHKRVDIDFGGAEDFILGVLNCAEKPPFFTLNHMFYIANMPYQVFGEHVKDVYGALSRADLNSLIPIDNQRRAEREFGNYEM